MAGAIKRIAGPAYLAASATDIYTPPNSAVFVRITHIHIANVTAGAVTATLYIGATGGSAGGTELMKGHSVAANSEYDWYSSPGLKMVSTDFLSGLASAGSSLVITIMGTYEVV